jgi:hypothetical protein
MGIGRQRSARITLAGLTTLAPLVAGCVQRTITITSQPQGALVHLNDQEVGRTPVTVPFTFYGTYDVRLEKEGFAPLSTMHKAKAPLLEYPGLDLLHEAIPGARVNLQWSFALQPWNPEQVDEAALVDHGRQMRALLKQDDLKPAPRQSSQAATDSQPAQPAE